MRCQAFVASFDRSASFIMLHDHAYLPFIYMYMYNTFEYMCCLSMQGDRHTFGVEDIDCSMKKKKQPTQNKKKICQSLATVLPTDE